VGLNIHASHLVDQSSPDMRYARNARICYWIANHYWPASYDDLIDKNAAAKGGLCGVWRCVFCGIRLH
jgi:hypothetical protein